ncbi:hypothetical protein IMG5_005520 [Ichthyophthirius multifiliis]|uniref:Uncharacterized protein n=1 Tax=Ichthyophthirius multifiliis TaxID=5932 RepID=G0QJH9_ICHMU|nr:hypothetical protein IMG5_005520 [Ichthyophthirius multifiliis]EGR34630.1 hypothetical protein IMG5_005520 [Ichthyophthirius multifiliis]|eukprot:XP_004039934.1 hypothetical protein IMG5_005520 [Ichthyophthirius multifiliis]
MSRFFYFFNFNQKIDFLIIFFIMIFFQIINILKVNNFPITSIPLQIFSSSQPFLMYFISFKKLFFKQIYFFSLFLLFQFFQFFHFSFSQFNSNFLQFNLFRIQCSFFIKKMLNKLFILIFQSLVQMGILIFQFNCLIRIFFLIFPSFIKWISVNLSQISRIYRLLLKFKQLIRIIAISINTSKYIFIIEIFLVQITRRFECNSSSNKYFPHKIHMFHSCIFSSSYIQYFICYFFYSHYSKSNKSSYISTCYPFIFSIQIKMEISRIQLPYIQFTIFLFIFFINKQKKIPHIGAKRIIVYGIPESFIIYSASNIVSAKWSPFIGFGVSFIVIQGLSRLSPQTLIHEGKNKCIPQTLKKTYLSSFISNFVYYILAKREDQQFLLSINLL